MYGRGADFADSSPYIHTHAHLITFNIKCEEPFTKEEKKNRDTLEPCIVTWESSIGWENHPKKATVDSAGSSRGQKVQTEQQALSAEWSEP